MIRINLTNPHIRNSVSNNTSIGSADSVIIDTSDDAVMRRGLMRLLMVCLGPLGLFFYQSYYLVPDYQTQFSQKSRALQDLTVKNEKAKSAVEETKKFQGDQTRLQTEIDSIEDIRKERMHDVKILDLLQREIPERAWLTKVEFKDQKVSIFGMAVADSEITELMDHLSKSGLLLDVNLISTTEKSVDGILVKEFNFVGITSRVNPAIDKAKQKGSSGRGGST